MPCHYTKGTIQAAIWCNKCNKETPWRIADGRRQFCLVCYQKATEARIPKPEPERGLFDPVEPT